MSSTYLKWSLMSDAAKVFGVHSETVKRLIMDGKLPATKFGNRWIIERDRLYAFASGYDGRRRRVRKLI